MKKSVNMKGKSVEVILFKFTYIQCVDVKN